METILSTVKALLNITDTSKDALLNVLIDQAEAEADSITHGADPEELYGCIAQMVVFRFNRIGAEGLNSEGYSGVSYSYSADYPEPLLRDLKAHRKVRFL